MPMAIELSEQALLDVPALTLKLNLKVVIPTRFWEDTRGIDTGLAAFTF
jgi:hypothetical protein